MTRPPRTHDSDWDSDDDDSNGEDTIPCPYCHEPIHEDSQRCPHCENYISEEDAPPTARSWWFVLGMILCLLVALMWALGH